MAAIEEDVLEHFIEELGGVDGITPHMIETLRPLLTSGNKLKPDEIVKIFTDPEAKEAS
jgi:hypothetical protein